MRPDNLLELFEINPAATDLPRDTRPDPAFGSRPLLVEFDDANPPETVLLDPGRVLPEPRSGKSDREPLPLSVPQRGQTLVSWALAVGVYLVTLLLLLPWDLVRTAPEPPIPVQLVIEQQPPPPPAPPEPATPPTPPPPPPPKPELKRPMGALASVDMGQKAGKPDAAEEKPEPPPEQQKAAVEAPKPQAPKPQPPKPEPQPISPTPTLTSALPKPTLPEEIAELPEPEAPFLDLTPTPRPKQPVSARAPLNPSPSPRQTEYPGPAASRNEYLAYCESLIRRYSGMVSDSFLAGRRGAATLTLLVLGNGTIARVSVVQSSGYQDIDARVEQMVAAVHRFPPLPQWFQGTTMPLMYHFAFPDRR